MQKDAQLSIRINAQLKTDVEGILNTLGIPVTTAITMFFNQIKLKNGIPFDLTIPDNCKKSFSEMTSEEKYNEIKKGLDDIESGNMSYISDIELKYNAK